MRRLDAVAAGPARQLDGLLAVAGFPALALAGIPALGFAAKETVHHRFHPSLIKQVQT